MTTFTLAPPSQPSADTGNVRVGALKYNQQNYSAETNPPTVRYAVIDLGANLPPIRVTNSGYFLCTDGGATQRWRNGQLETLGGSEPYGYDINEDGTVVGYVGDWSYTSLNQYDFYTNPNGVFLATKCPAGQTAPVNINPTVYPYHFENPQATVALESRMGNC